MKVAYGIVLTVAACLLGFTKRRSLVVTTCILIIMWVLMGLNTMNADFMQYKYLYDYKLLDASGVNSGYLAAEHLSWALGLDFLQFRMLFAAIGLILIASFVRRYSSCPNVVLALYLLLPFLYDVVQFKFFMAASVAIFSMRFLIDRTKLYGLKYAIGIAISSLIHPAALLFCVFGIGLFDGRTAFRVALTATVFIVAAVYSGFASYLSSFILDPIKRAAYMSELGRFGWIPYLVSIVSSVAIAYFASPLRHAEKLPEAIDGEARFLAFFESAKFAFLPLLALLPLSLQNFYRPIRSANLLFLMYFSSYSSSRDNSFPQPEKVALTVFFIIWLVFTQVVLYRGVIDTVLIPELTYNLIWS